MNVFQKPSLCTIPVEENVGDFDYDETDFSKLTIRPQFPAFINEIISKKLVSRTIETPKVTLLPPPVSIPHNLTGYHPPAPSAGAPHPVQPVVGLSGLTPAVVSSGLTPTIVSSHPSNTSVPVSSTPPLVSVAPSSSAVSLSNSFGGPTPISGTVTPVARLSVVPKLLADPFKKKVEETKTPDTKPKMSVSGSSPILTTLSSVTNTVSSSHKASSSFSSGEKTELDGSAPLSVGDVENILQDTLPDHPYFLDLQKKNNDLRKNIHTLEQKVEELNSENQQLKTVRNLFLLSVN
jgi:hypothetical protein